MGTMLEYLRGGGRAQTPVEVDVEAEAGGEVVRDPTSHL